MQYINDRELCVNSKLCKPDGKAMLGMETLKFREVRPEHIQKMLQQASDDIEEDVLEQEWAPFDAPAGKAGSLPGKVLFMGASAALRAALEAKFPSAAFLDLDDWDSDVTKATVVHVGALCGDALEMEVMESAMELCKAGMVLADKKPKDAPAIWWITRGTQAVGTALGYAYAGLWGMARTARMEERDLKLRCLDLDASHGSALEVAEALAHWLGLLSGSPAAEAETEVAIRPQGEAGEAKALCSRLTRSALEIRKPTLLLMSSRGSLGNLRPVPQVLQEAPKSDEIQIRVRSIGLNFRDVLNVMGMYPGDPGNPGGDCAGTVIQVGSDVKDLRPGHDVFGIAMGCLKTYCNTDHNLMAPKPAGWSFEQMAAWPVTFTTVEESFQELAPVKKGERVLIHAATGGVGLVAVQFAQRVGAVIFATAGREDKVEHLRAMGVKYITSTRDGTKFEAEMKEFIKQDGNGGLDCVLNSLSHDDYIGSNYILNMMMMMMMMMIIIIIIIIIVNNTITVLYYV